MSQVFFSIRTLVIRCQLVNVWLFGEFDTGKHCNNQNFVDKSGHPIGDCVLMKDGRMMMITKGKMMPITKDITLADGTVCKVDGTCVLKNGKQIKLSNGEGIEVAGEQVFRVKGLSPPGSHFQ
jgi:hypothetical protein